jgi:hypothetical protein
VSLIIQQAVCVNVETFIFGTLYRFFNHFHPTGGRINPVGMDFENLSFRQPATVPLDYETHSGEDVGVYADGPWAHLFTGVYEQNFIAHGLMYATCLGPKENAQSKQCVAYRNGVDRGATLGARIFFTVICVVLMNI